MKIITITTIIVILILTTGCTTQNSISSQLDEFCQQKGHGNMTDFRYKDKAYEVRFMEPGSISHVHVECDSEHMYKDVPFITLEDCKERDKWDECIMPYRVEQLVEE